MNTNLNYYNYNVFKYYNIIIAEKILKKKFGCNKIHIDGVSLKIEIGIIEIGEIEIESCKELMLIKIKMFSIENNPKTAIEIGTIKSLKNFYDGKFYSLVRFY